jgi:hypothetical protein
VQGYGTSGNFYGTIHDCTIFGGRGGDGDPYVAGGMFPANGGPAVDELGGDPLTIMGSTLQGGDEGDFNPPETTPGAALQLVITNVYVRDSILLPGTVTGVGTPTDPVVSLFLGMVHDYLAPTRSLSVPSPVREGESSNLHVEGEPGDVVWVLLGLTGHLKEAQSLQGFFVVGSVVPTPMSAGLIGGSGVLDLPFHAPDLPGGLDGVLVTMQSVAVPSTGGPVVGSGTAFVWLDSTL